MQNPETSSSEKEVDLASPRTKCCEFEAKKSERDAELASLQKTSYELAKRIQSMDAKSSSLQETLEALTEKFASKDAELASLHGATQKLVSRLSERDAELVSLRDMCDITKGKLFDSEDRMRTFLVQGEATRLDLEGQRCMRKDTEKMRDSLEAKEIELRTEIDHMKVCTLAPFAACALFLFELLSSNSIDVVILFTHSSHNKAKHTVLYGARLKEIGMHSVMSAEHSHSLSFHRSGHSMLRHAVLSGGRLEGSWRHSQMRTRTSCSLSSRRSCYSILQRIVLFGVRLKRMSRHSQMRTRRCVSNCRKLRGEKRRRGERERCLILRERRLLCGDKGR